jgi:hypothetical protein
MDGRSQRFHRESFLFEDHFTYIEIDPKTRNEDQKIDTVAMLGQVNGRNVGMIQRREPREADQIAAATSR